MLQKQSRQKTGRKSIFNQDQQKYIIDRYLTTPYAQLASELGFTERQVRGWINNHCKKKYREFNDQYFNVIDTAEKAYWLGFILADGWISIHKHGRTDELPSYEFGMQLQRRDRYMLERLNAAFGNKHVIADETIRMKIAGNMHVTSAESSILRVYSKKLVQSLEKYGITPKKTYDDSVPIVDDLFLPDFLRGYIDGDGCICLQHHDRHLVVHITAFSKQRLEKLRDLIHDKLGVSSRIYSEGDRKHRLVVYRQDDVKRFLDLLYRDPDCMRLERKYQIYQTFYGLAA